MLALRYSFVPNIQHDSRFQLGPKRFSDAPNFQTAFDVDKFLCFCLHYLTCCVRIACSLSLQISARICDHIGQPLEGGIYDPLDHNPHLPISAGQYGPKHLRRCLEERISPVQEYCKMALK